MPRPRTSQSTVILPSHENTQDIPGQVDERHISEAARTLRDGGVVIFPTDTIYALGCDALNHRAIERMCRIKGIDPKCSRFRCCVPI